MRRGGEEVVSSVTRFVYVSLVTENGNDVEKTELKGRLASFVRLAGNNLDGLGLDWMRLDYVGLS